MVQKFKHSSLHFSITWFIVIESLCSDSVNFIYEDNCGSLLFCKGESVSDHLRTVTDVHLNEVWPGEFEESSFCLTCTCSGHHCFSCTWRTEHEASLWGSDTDVIELIFVSNWQDDGFSQFLNLLIKATDVGILFRRSLFYFHGSDSGVILCR